MRAFSPASTVDKWRRFTLSSGFTLNVPSRTPQQMCGRKQTYPLLDFPPHGGATEPLSRCSAPRLSLLNTSDRLDFLDSLG